MYLSFYFIFFQLRMIRKLGIFEQYFHDQTELNGTVSASSFLFKSPFDLFVHKNIVYKSVQLWKQTQPFLRSKVENNCFRYASDEQIQNLDNIQFVYFKSPHTDKTKDYWKLLIEHEYTKPINWQDGLMWRLMFIKLDNKHWSPLQYEYCLLITATHSFLDGQSAFLTISSLFLIIEDLYYSNNLNNFYKKDALVADSMEK